MSTLNAIGTHPMIDKLRPGRWLLWHDALLTAARAMGVARALEQDLLAAAMPDEAAPDATPRPADTPDTATNDRALQLLKSGLEDADKMVVLGERSAFRALTRLKELNAQQSQARVD